MKQYITLGEMKSHLSPDGDHHINKLIRDGYVEETIFTIGKMIEFLSNKFPDGLVPLKIIPDCWIEPNKICDDLWEAVKEKLEEKE